ncbi:MAG: class I SAM-dependent methyltransferase [Roseitalea sp.]|nr:class I SAM-dependent methyltransferase [Roseitalea sp.]MBO6720696.1 class I SAM-dependent methyltransferase [Roseitalea sp.]MBO6743843.1 class I SAM-dependent methyltransferase [Roseitalea sp.]
MAIGAKLLDRLLKRTVRVGRLELTYPDGRTITYGQRTACPVRVRIDNARWLGRVVLNPELRVGEAYMEGVLMPRGRSIYDLLDLVWINFYGEDHKGQNRLPVRLLRTMQSSNPPSRARQNVAHHYDLGDPLYRLFLDDDMQYSCAYFDRPDMSLDEAQIAKKEHIARKLLIQPGHRVLDIGSGWGGLALDLARRGAADVLGITLSSEQLTTARRRAVEQGVSDRVHFELIDYRALDGRFDRIVSVGMLEHVGPRHYAEYFAQIARFLADDGVALIHTIGRTTPPGVTNPWIDKYIFPGGYIPALSEIMQHVEKYRLQVLDIEVLRLHYAETLRAWRKRFLDNADKAAELYDERFVRMWDFYLSGSELSFRHGDHAVFQLQLGRRQDAAPLTRDYMYGSPSPNAASQAERSVKQAV